MYRPRSTNWPDPEQDQAPHYTDPICPGRCNSGYRFAEERYGTGGHAYEPREGQPVWCPPCATRIRGALCDMPEIAVRLQLEIDSGTAASASDEEFVAGSKERALHEHQAPAFTLEEIAGWLADWEDTVRQQCGLPDRQPQPTQHKTVEASSWFLRHHLNWLLAEADHEAAEGFGIEILALHCKAQFLTKSQDVTPDRCHGVACPYCDGLCLEREVDELGMATGYIRCRRCRPILRLSPEEYRRWTGMLAADARARGLAAYEKLTRILRAQYTPAPSAGNSGGRA